MTAPNTVQPSTYGPIFPTTITKADDVLAAAAKAGHKVTRVYGYNTTADHNNKKCIDFMHYGNAAIRDFLVAYLKANAARLGVAGMISDHKVMGFPSQGSAYRGPEGQWRGYTGPNPHTDHVHVEFNTNPIKAAPKPAPSKPAVKPAPKPVRKTVAQIAVEVIAGKWGNGPVRVARLRAAGYDAKAVQAEVNRRLR